MGDTIIPPPFLNLIPRYVAAATLDILCILEYLENQIGAAGFLVLDTNFSIDSSFLVLPPVPGKFSGAFLIMWMGNLTL